MKKWIIRKPDSAVVNALLKESDLTPLCAEVLSSRGIKNINEAAAAVQAEELQDPFLLRDMAEAVSVINLAVEEFVPICIYGDYDCDGITSTAMLYSYLECMGADVTYYIPERDEGYGMNCDSIRKLAKQGIKLIITVDNGISAIEEAELIKELGMKLIVTDHHQPGATLPEAEAVIDPHRRDCPSPYKNLCGAGVVLKLIAAMEGGSYETAMEQFGDLAALGTVADVVRLDGENRYIVKNGLRLIENTEKTGLVSLIEKSGLKGKKLTSHSIGFMLAPRINAAGRFGSPYLAAKLMLSEDPNESDQLAQELDTLNSLRKNAESDIIGEIEKMICEDPSIILKRVLVISGKNWHHGIIGIVASRLMERFLKPCIIITEEGEFSRGSARGCPGFSVFKCLEYCEELLEKFGGHTGAGGFTVKTSRLKGLDNKIQEYARRIHAIMPTVEITADKQLMPQDITAENIDGLKLLEPFGEGCQQPVFAIAGAVISDIIPLSGGVHTKLRLNFGGKALDALLFRKSPEELFIKKGDRCDFMITAETSVYAGKKSVTVIVKDFRLSGIRQQKYFAAKDAYEKYRRGEKLPPAYYSKICPDRGELIPVYKRIFAGQYDTDGLYAAISGETMNFCKLKICVDIFCELGLVKFNPFTDEVRVVKGAPKADIETSPTLINLKNAVRETEATINE